MPINGSRNGENKGMSMKKAVSYTLATVFFGAALYYAVAMSIKGAAHTRAVKEAEIATNTGVRADQDSKLILKP